MSIFACGTAAMNRKIKDPKLSKEAKSRIYNKMINLAKDWELGKGFENVKKSGWNDMETFNWIYKEYTHKSIDPNFTPTNFSDMRKFELGLREYNNRVGKPSGIFARNFYLPVAAMQNIPELQRFERNLVKESSFFRDYSVQSGRQVNHILADFNTFALGMGMTSKFPSIIKGVNSKIRKLYKEYEQLNNRLPLANNSTERAQISAKLRANREAINAFYESGSGKAIKIFNNVLQGADIETIDGITSEQKTLLRNMKSNYVEIRKNSAKGLIRGLQQIRKMSKEKDLKWVDSTVDKINALIKQIEFQKRIDESGNLIDFKDLQSERDFVGLGFKATEGYNTTSDKRVAFSKHYMSQYTLGILKTIRKVEEAVHDNKIDLDVELKREIEDWEGIVNIAKPKNPLSNNIYDADPFFYLKKYTSDVGMFNYRVHVKSNFTEAVTTLTKEHLDVARESGDKNLEESALSMLRLVREVNEQVQIQDPTAKGWLDDVARAATSFTYFRLMGGNIRSAARNGTQRIYELVEFGMRAAMPFVGQAAKWYRTSGLGQKRNEKVGRQMQNFGLQWFDGKDVKSTYLESIFGADKTQRLSELSRGALEDAHTVDGNLYIDKNGELTIRSGERITEKAARTMSTIAGKSGIAHKIIEDWNRSKTFKVAFALIHNNLEGADRGWIARQMLDINKIREEKGSDYVIGYKDLYEKFGDKVEARIDNWVESTAGQMAYNSTLDLHFEYAKWNKAKIVRSSERDNMLIRGTKTMLGQFSHYRFNMFNLMYKWMNQAGKSWRAGDINSEESRRFFRFGVLQLMITGAGLTAKQNFHKLMPNDVMETSEAMYYWLAANREKLVEGEVSAETEEMFNKKTYGQKGWYFLGPNVGYLLGAAELIHKTYDPGAEPIFEKAELKAFKNPEAKELYDKIARFNAQAARSWAYTKPMYTGGGNFWDVTQLELGLFPDKRLREQRKSIGEAFGFKKKKRGSKKQYTPAELEAVLDLFK